MIVPPAPPSGPLSPELSPQFSFCGSPVLSASPSGGPICRVLILDWDDTCFPTTALRQLVPKCRSAQDVREADLSELGDAGEQFETTVMGHLCPVLIQLIATAKENDVRVVIITNAQEEWVTSCLHRFFPSLLRVLVDEGIEVVSARKVYMATLAGRSPQLLANDRPQVTAQEAGMALPPAAHEKRRRSSRSSRARLGSNNGITLPQGVNGLSHENLASLPKDAAPKGRSTAKLMDDEETHDSTEEREKSNSDESQQCESSSSEEREEIYDEDELLEMVSWKPLTFSLWCTAYSKRAAAMAHWRHTSPASGPAPLPLAPAGDASGVPLSIVAFGDTDADTSAAMALLGVLPADSSIRAVQLTSHPSARELVQQLRSINTRVTQLLTSQATFLTKVKSRPVARPAPTPAPLEAAAATQ